jgi:hypothetical protein
MALKLIISPEMEAKIRAFASMSGQDMESFILQAVNEKLADAESTPKVTFHRGEDWAQKLRACIDLHPAVTHFVDDSRESIYAGHGE